MSRDRKQPLHCHLLYQRQDEPSPPSGELRRRGPWLQNPQGTVMMPGGMNGRCLPTNHETVPVDQGAVDIKLYGGRDRAPRRAWREVLASAPRAG
jgi:hypothetical protein